MYLFIILIASIVLIVLATTRLNMHPFLALLAATLFFGLLAGISFNQLLSSINEGFGGTIGNIGIIIIAGIVIGTFLEESGGAFKLANSIIRIIGPKRLHTAMGVIGFITSIPVFADSGFIILSSLNKALTRRAGLSLAGTAIALSMGLLATHTMVPPTPGPIAAASIVEADLGKVILFGLAASLISLSASIIFAKHAGSRIRINLEGEEQVEDNQHKKMPSAGHSFLPIIVPIVLIILKSISDYPTAPFGSGALSILISFIGHPVIALLIGMLISFSLPAKFEMKMLGTTGWVGKALINAAIIILITGAGGAFGKVLQNSDISTILETGVSAMGLGIWLPFLLAATIKSSQGSSTVAIITTASLIAPFLPAMGLEDDLSRALVVVAIGAGSAVVSHANDSFFWVVTQMSNMSVRQGYRLQSLGSAVLGFSAMIVVWLLSVLL